jgi:hypothetical protein
VQIEAYNRELSMAREVQWRWFWADLMVNGDPARMVDGSPQP